MPYSVMTFSTSLRDVVTAAPCDKMVVICEMISSAAPNEMAVIAIIHTKLQQKSSSLFISGYTATQLALILIIYTISCVLY